MIMHSSGTTSGVCFVFTFCLFLSDGVFGDEVSVMEGGSVTFNTGVTKQQHDKMRWYFNNTLIAHVNGDPSKSCLFDGEDGIFRDRLKVNYETGSLTITNIRSEHTGRYELEFIQSKSSGTSESLNRNSKCDRTRIILKRSNIGNTIKIVRVFVSASLSVPDKNLDESYEKGKEQENDERFQISLVVAGIAVVLLVFVAAAAVGVIYYRRRRSTNADKEKNKLEHLLKV